MLARSYKVMGRYAEAEQAFLRAVDLLNTDPDLLVDYADLLAVRADSNIDGRPLALVSKALVLNPRHPMGLMMSGVAAQWEKLLAMLKPGSPDAQQVETNIAESRAKGGPGSKSKSNPYFVNATPLFSAASTHRKPGRRGH